jgi:hypothetical protein
MMTITIPLFSLIFANIKRKSTKRPLTANGRSVLGTGNWGGVFGFYPPDTAENIKHTLYSGSHNEFNK